MFLFPNTSTPIGFRALFTIIALVVVLLSILLREDVKGSHSTSPILHLMLPNNKLNFINTQTELKRLKRENPEHEISLSRRGVLKYILVFTQICLSLFVLATCLKSSKFADYEGGWRWRYWDLWMLYAGIVGVAVWAVGSWGWVWWGERKENGGAKMVLGNETHREREGRRQRTRKGEMRK
jgi:hypothetical protein